MVKSLLKGNGSLFNSLVVAKMVLHEVSGIGCGSGWGTLLLITLSLSHAIQPFIDSL